MPRNPFPRRRTHVARRFAGRAVRLGPKTWGYITDTGVMPWALRRAEAARALRLAHA